MDWTTWLSPAWGMVYLLIASLAGRRPTSPPVMKRPLQGYALASAGWELMRFAERAGWLGFIDSRAFTWIWPLGIMVLSLVLLYCTTEFLPARENRRVYLWVGGALTSILLAGGILASLEVPLAGDLLRLTRTGIFLAGLAFMSLSGLLTLQAFIQARNPLHRERVIYWGTALALTAAGDILLLLGWDIAGGTLRVVGTVVAAYIIMLRKMVDFVQMVLWGVYGVMVGGITAAVFAFVIYQDLPFVRGGRLVESVLKGMGLALIVNLGMGVISRFLFSQIFGTSYDQTSVVSNYTQAISSALELSKLADAAEAQISKVLGARSVRLFTVNYLPVEHVFCLDAVVTDHQPDMPPGRLAASGPVGEALSEAHKPLAQYEIDFHPAFQATEGVERQWLSGLQADLYVPIHAQDTWQGLLVLEAKKSGERYNIRDIELLTTLGEQTAVALQNARLFSDVVALNEDLQLAQQALEKANLDLQQVDHLKTIFISIVSHELRTPLANISFSAQVLEMYGKEHFTDEEKEQLVQLTKGIWAVRGMIDNLITVASFLNEEVNLLPAEIDFREVVDDALSPLEERAAEKQLKFRVNVVGDEFQIVGDRKLLKQAVHELVSNAIKFTPQGGEVFVSCWTSSDALCFDVQDTGIGIPEEKMNEVWESFSQVQNEGLRRGVEGLGLGLALVKFVVRAHGGFAWVESNVAGQGSVFGFQVPLRGPRYPLNPITALKNMQK